MTVAMQWALWVAGMACFLVAAVLKMGIPGGLVVLGFCLVRVSGIMPDTTNLGSIITVLGGALKAVMPAKTVAPTEAK